MEQGGKLRDFLRWLWMKWTIFSFFKYFFATSQNICSCSPPTLTCSSNGLPSQTNPFMNVHSFFSGSSTTLVYWCLMKNNLSTSHWSTPRRCPVVMTGYGTTFSVSSRVVFLATYEEPCEEPWWAQEGRGRRTPSVVQPSQLLWASLFANRRSCSASFYYDCHQCHTHNTVCSNWYYIV